MKYDFIVIGGGPSGMMAAGRAAECGASVLLLEKNDRLGVKLLMTGKGRCNFTNAEPDVRSFVEKLGRNGKFLFSPLSKFGIQDSINFFERMGVPTKIERGNRVFPKSDRSSDVVKALEKYLKQRNVEIRLNTKVKSIDCKNNKIEKIVLEDGKDLEAEKYLICTGGKSYISTGSNGCAYPWLEKMGHNIISPEPALTPIILKEKWIKRVEGLSLKNIEINIYQNGKKAISRFGEALFTSKGMSGPIIIDISKEIGKLLKKGDVELQIDFKPALDFQTLDKRIQKDFKEFNNKMFKNSLDSLLPKTLIPIVVYLSKINPGKKVNLITKEERTKLIHLLKEFKLNVKELEGFANAIITSGGVDLKEIDPKTMKSKIVGNLYLAGEVVDLDGPTGGYNLQECWTTGFVAGDNFSKE